MSWTLLKQAELESKYADVYLYQFSYKGKLGGQMNSPNIPGEISSQFLYRYFLIPSIFSGAEKVGHSEDLRYFWSTLYNSDLSQFPEDDKLMLHQHTTMWTNFIKYRYVLLFQNITNSFSQKKRESHFKFCL